MRPFDEVIGSTHGVEVLRVVLCLHLRDFEDVLSVYK